MNIGIIGLPQTGKKSLFELLVGQGALDHQRDSTKTARGVAEVQDSRFTKLSALYNPKKHTRARVDVLLPPRIEEHAVSQADIFRDLSEVEVFCHVVRAFEDDSVYHVSGSIDPVRDIDFINAEFILHDLIFIEKRLKRLEKDLMKRKDEEGEKVRQILLGLKEPLEQEKPLRCVDIPPEDEGRIRSYPLLSRREMIIVVNVSDDDVADTKRMEELNARYADSKIEIVEIPIKVELEIASLDSEEERKEFMEELGIHDVALHVLTEQCIDALGLISFFTAAPNELRQWFVRSGSNAVEAAGKIHSDLARGFIRAEVIGCDDLIALGSEEKVKTAGKLAVKGKDYIVEDGDILFVRFNV